MEALNLNNQPLNGFSGTTTTSGITLNFANPFGPQVEAGIKAAGVKTIRETDVVNLPVQAHAATIAAAFIYGVRGVLPVVPVLDPNAGWAVSGSYDPWKQRQEARTRRGSGEQDGRKYLLNFAHPIAPEVMGEIADHFGVAGDDIVVVNVKVQLDVKADLYQQFSAICDVAEIGNWETANILAINPPTMGLAALGVLAEIHGRRGNFPPVLSIRETERGKGFHLVETLNLMQEVENGRQWAGAEDASTPRIVISGTMPDGFLLELQVIATKYGVEVG